MNRHSLWESSLKNKLFCPYFKNRQQKLRGCNHLCGGRACPYPHQEASSHGQTPSCDPEAAPVMFSRTRWPPLSSGGLQAEASAAGKPDREAAAPGRRPLPLYLLQKFSFLILKMQSLFQPVFYYFQPKNSIGLFLYFLIL